MKGPMAWMAENHVASNLLMLVFVVGGLVIGTSVKQEVFPEINLDRITVSVAYPGASPSEVEEGIVLKIEESISGIQGIKELQSKASEGFGMVMAEVMTEEDPDRVLQDIKTEIDRITTFPADAEKPVVTKMVSRREVISVVVYGDLNERTLREYAEEVRDELLELPEITQVDMGGVRPYEISINVSEENLRRHSLTIGQIAEKVRQASVDIPAGSVKSAGGEILIRTKERKYSGLEYADIIVLTNPDGTRVRLGDIADVKDSFRESDEFARFDGYPAAMMAVYRVGNQKPTGISEAVKKYVETKKQGIPESVKLATWFDTSELFESRKNLLFKNAFYGLVLVFLTLGLFLQPRLAIFVMLGIPISFLGALMIMPAGDVSINMMTLFAFILALGIVVDDAVVVGENIYEHRKIGKSHLRAAVDGAKEVTMPVVFSVLTTVAAFSPLFFVSGLLGKFIGVIPYIVISILMISLVESLFILPAHLSYGMPEHSSRARISKWFGGKLERFIEGPYRKLISWCIGNRYIVMASSIALLLITFGVVAGGIIKFRFMPDVDSDRITVSLDMPFGTPAEETKGFQGYILEKIDELTKEYDAKRPEGDSILRHVYAIVGGRVSGTMAVDEGSASAGHFGDIAILLAPSEYRGVPSAEIAAKLRNMVGEIPGADSLTYNASLAHFGASIDVKLSHDDFSVLNRASERLKAALSRYPGVGDVSDSYTLGKRELRVSLTPEGRSLGLTEEELGKQIRAAFYGVEALKIQRGRNEVRVLVRYPEADRKSRDSLETMRIRTRDGGEAPLIRAAHIDEGRGFSVINRTDRKRVIDVTADVDSSVNNAEDVIRDLNETILKELKNDYPGLSFDLAGEQKERKESMASMQRGFMMALFLIYALLAIPLRSYIQPFIIMAAIPFGFVSAVAGHLLMGYDLSMLSMFGIVALAGVVVNNSLLLIDYINRRRGQGESREQAVIESGKRRFRPILLTSLTTFFGLAPMILEKSMQAQFLIPMAISLGFGILFCTAITLLITPSLYMVVEDLKSLFGIGGAD